MNGDCTLSMRRVGELSLYVRIMLYVRVFFQEIIATIVGIPLPTDIDDQFIVKPKLLDSQNALDKWVEPFHGDEQRRSLVQTCVLKI